MKKLVLFFSSLFLCLFSCEDKGIYNCQDLTIEEAKRIIKIANDQAKDYSDTLMVRLRDGNSVKVVFYRESLKVVGRIPSYNRTYVLYHPVNGVLIDGTIYKNPDDIKIWEDFEESLKESNRLNSNLNPSFWINIIQEKDYCLMLEGLVKGYKDYKEQKGKEVDIPCFVLAVYDRKVKVPIVKEIEELDSIYLLQDSLPEVVLDTVF